MSLSNTRLISSSVVLGKPIFYRRAFSSLNTNILSHCNLKWTFDSSWLILTCAFCGISKKSNGSCNRWLWWAIAPSMFICLPINWLLIKSMFRCFNFSIERRCFISSSSCNYFSKTYSFFFWNSTNFCWTSNSLREEGLLIFKLGLVGSFSGVF